MPLFVDGAADRPALKSTDEIEITPEMIEAGVEFLENSMVSSFMSVHSDFVEDFLRSAIVGGRSRKSFVSSKASSIHSRI